MLAGIISSNVSVSHVPNDVRNFSATSLADISDKMDFLLLGEESALLNSMSVGLANTSFIPNATDAEKESTVNLAVEHKITNSGIVGLIKKYCGVDVIQAIAVKHDAEEK